MSNEYRRVKDEFGHVEITNGEDSVHFVNEFVDLLNGKQELIDELYDFRLIYNCLLFNKWYSTNEFEVYKSRRHDDGELCFEGEYFIVVALLPSGQISNHYPIEYWDLFKIKEYPLVKDSFDGHTSQDVLDRLFSII